MKDTAKHINTKSKNTVLITTLLFSVCIAICILVFSMVYISNYFYESYCFEKEQQNLSVLLDKINYEDFDAQLTPPVLNTPVTTPTETPSAVATPAPITPTPAPSYYPDIKWPQNLKIGSNGIFKEYEVLVGINKDFKGWINIPNTKIDYPIMQSKDNSYYLRHTFYKSWLRQGSIFLDYRNDINFTNNDNYILYGHNIKDGTMFYDLTKYKNYDFFMNNRYIYINSLSQQLVFEVFSVFITPYDDFYYLYIDFSNDVRFAKYIKDLKDISIMFNESVSAVTGDTLLTLSTCTYERLGNYSLNRLVVVAKLVDVY